MLSIPSAGAARSRGSRIHAIALLRFLATLVALSLAGCEARNAQNAESVMFTTSISDNKAVNTQTCESGWTQELIRPKLAGKSATPYSLLHAAPLHSAGDVVRLDISEGVEFAGTYRVNLDGHINVPYAGRIAAAGLTTSGLTKSVKKRLVDKGLFHPGQLDLSIIPVEWAPIQITVAGAVFQPGRGLINNGKDKSGEAVAALGDSPHGRFLDAGLRIGAGVRPDADLSQIALSRSGKHYRIDLSGVIDGAPVPDIYLMHGDHIEVPSAGCRQAALMRPSQVTPPGIRIFTSNLTVPVTNNADQHKADVPYGTRLLEAAISANCVGGTFMTNGARRIAYVSSQAQTSQVKEYRVNDLLANPNDMASNPFMMPNDAIACFDSEVVNIRDATRALTEMLSLAGLAVSLL